MELPRNSARLKKKTRRSGANGLSKDQQKGYEEMAKLYAREGKNGKNKSAFGRIR